MTTEQELIELRDAAASLARELERLAERAEPWRREGLRIARGEALAIADDLDQLVRPVSARFRPAQGPDTQRMPVPR